VPGLCDGFVDREDDEWRLIQLAQDCSLSCLEAKFVEVGQLAEEGQLETVSELFDANDCYFKAPIPAAPS
jgi:hypothetical protein